MYNFYARITDYIRTHRHAYTAQVGRRMSINEVVGELLDSII